MAEISWLRGGGTAGNIILASGWSHPALGAPASWPQPLCTALGMALNAPMPTLLIWGPSRLLFYNDAFAVCIGASHPAAFGVPLADVAFWPSLRVRHLQAIEACFSGVPQQLSNQALDVDRAAGARPAWFDFFYAPVGCSDSAGATGQAEAVVVTLIDASSLNGGLERGDAHQLATGQQLQRINRALVAQRDTAEEANRELSGEASFLRELLQQSPSFIAVVRGPEHVFELVNDTYLRLFGDAAVIGRPIREGFPALLDGSLFDLLDEVYRTGATYATQGAKVFLRQGHATQFSELVLDFVLQPMTGADGAVDGIFIEGIDVTERFVAEERLRIADSAGGIGIFEWFPESGKLVVSERFRQLWGIAADVEVTSEQLIALIDEQYRPQLGVSRLHQRENPLEYTEYAITRPDNGEPRWLARKGEVVRDDPRTAKRYVGVVFDVTERKRMEQALAASEASVRANNAFVRQLLDSTDQGFYSIDRAGLVTLCNASFIRMLGFAGEHEVLGRRLHDVIHHSHADGRHYALADSPVYQAAHAGTSAHVIDEVLFRTDGSSFPVEYRAHPVWQDGELCGALCTFVDLTERQRSLQALMWSENRLTAIFNQASVCFSELDLQGRYLRVNEALCGMLERSQEELLALTLADVTHPDDVPINMSMFNRCIEDGRSFTLEKRYVRPDGSTFWVSSNISRIVDAEGRPQAMIAVSTDITERRRAEEALHELNDTLEQRVVEEILERSRAEAALSQMQKMEAVGQLTGGVAHDFNNVLQIIGGNLQLLQSDPALDERARQRLRVAIGAVDRGAKLSSQLLAFARRQPLQPRAINLDRVVQNMEDLLRRAVGETIEISASIAPELWNTMLDPNQLENLIINTAINARDAMPSGGRLTLQLENVQLSDPYFLSQADLAPGDYVLLAISDNGHGMSREVRERAFEPFFTTKKEGEGTGLGLSMAYGFVKQSRGHISIHSEQGRGTTIRIYFPRSREDEAVIDDNREMEVRGGDETILVVEDDPNLQLTVIDTLSSLGYRVLKADNGERALAIVQSGIPIDMVFTDVVMPGSVPATELARQARQLLPDIEILFTSGYPRDAIVHEGRLDAGVELLSKPYRSNQLARRIRHMLSNAQQRQQLRAGSAARVGADVAAAGASSGSATIHVLPVAERQRQDELERVSELQQAQQPRWAAQGGVQAQAGVVAAVPEVAAAQTSGLRLLVVEDNIDSQQLVCELLETLGHVARGVGTGEEAQKVLEEQAFDVLFTDVNLPGMSGVELAKLALARFPEIAVIFASGYGAMVARNVGFASHSLPKPYDIDQLQDILRKIAAH